MSGLIILGVLALVAVWCVSLYNSLIRLRNRYKNGYAQIDVQLKRRYDLIPNLVETAKSYLKHERETLQEVITARNAAQSASGAAALDPGNPEAMKQLAQAEGTLTGVLGRLFALAEAYPDLKGNTSMNQLMEELTSTESRVAFARQAYNDAVTQYNTRRESFPTVIFSGPMGFRQAELFEVDSFEEREAPQVSFD